MVAGIAAANQNDPTSRCSSACPFFPNLHIHFVLTTNTGSSLVGSVPDILQFFLKCFVFAQHHPFCCVCQHDLCTIHGCGFGCCFFLQCLHAKSMCFIPLFSLHVDGRENCIALCPRRVMLVKRNFQIFHGLLLVGCLCRKLSSKVCFLCQCSEVLRKERSGSQVG